VGGGAEKEGWPKHCLFKSPIKEGCDGEYVDRIWDQGGGIQTTLNSNEKGGF